MLVAALLAALVPTSGLAQSELLPLDHPATRLLLRLDRYGAIPHFPAEHLPVSRGAALEFLQKAVDRPSLPDALRRQAEWYIAELGVDRGLAPVRVVVPVNDSQRSVLDAPGDNSSWAIVDYRDTSLGLHVALLPVLDGEFRSDPDEGSSSAILQGGFELRGTLLDHVGFSARVTNGTILGDSTLPLRDPRFSRSGKFGVLGFGRDVDFGRGHLRADFGVVALGIGREGLALGGGGGGSGLLLGSALPSNFDWIRLRSSIGPFDFSHVHAAVLADPLTRFGAGPAADIPTKYIAAHALSIGPFAGVRLTLGESLVYSGRPFEIGYLNPLNFLKSQEHYLRDRDNSNMYASIGINPVRGVFLEGEFLLDDLQFSLIGDGHWANKTAWRVAASLTGVPLGFLDISGEYLRLEPYVYSHFNPINAYTHDGTVAAADGLQPNSDALRAGISVYPLANLSVILGAGIVRHGANVTGLDSAGEVTLVRNVGGDVRFSIDFDRDSPIVEFLDGVSERTLNLSLELLYEPLRNIYLRLKAHRSTLQVDGAEAGSDTQIWLGMRVGAF